MSQRCVARGLPLISAGYNSYYQIFQTRDYVVPQIRDATDRNLQLTERFTRVGPNTISYEGTVSDPTTWTRPWSFMIPWKQTKDPIYEFACHEGMKRCLVRSADTVLKRKLPQKLRRKVRTEPKLAAPDRRHPLLAQRGATLSCEVLNVWAAPLSG